MLVILQYVSYILTLSNWFKCNNQCKGVLATSLDISQVLGSKPHNHDANPMQVAVTKAKLDMIELAFV